jgi:hypothetical protein
VPELRLVQQMLNALRRQLVKSGDLLLIKYRTPPLSKFAGFVGPSEAARVKSLRARKRQRKAARRDRAHTAMLDRLGLDDRPRRRAA